MKTKSKKRRVRSVCQHPDCGHVHQYVIDPDDGKRKCGYEKGTTNMGGRETYISIVCGCPKSLRSYSEDV